MDDALIRLAYLDSHRLFREALTTFLGARSEFELLLADEVSPEVLGRVRSLGCELALIGCNGDPLANLDWIRRVRGVLDNGKVVALALTPSHEEIVSYIQAGAAGYVLPTASSEQLVASLVAAHKGEAMADPGVLGSVVARIAELIRSQQIEKSSIPLTVREHEVLTLMAKGMSNKEIAKKLGISFYTVKNHIHNLLEKLEVHRRREAILCGYDLGLLPPTLPPYEREARVE